MKNFDPFRFSQNFEPEPTECELPPVGLLPYEELPTPSKSNPSWKLLIIVPFALLLLASMWSQSKGELTQPPNRSVFH